MRSVAWLAILVLAGCVAPGPAAHDAADSQADEGEPCLRRVLVDAEIDSIQPANGNGYVPLRVL